MIAGLPGIAGTVLSPRRTARVRRSLRRDRLVVVASVLVILKHQLPDQARG